MRVMCIKQGRWVHRSGKVSEDLDPEYGDICKVEREININSTLVYCLSGYVGIYNADKFIPLSDIDERKLLEQRQEQLQND